MADNMMPPGRWSNGVPTANYAAPLMDFSPMGKLGDTIAGKMMPQKPQGGAPGQPMQLTPGPGQAQPVRPQMPMAQNMNAMASTANAMPWASALMRMLGGGQGGVQQMNGGGGVNLGSAGGMNPFLGQSPIY